MCLSHLPPAERALRSKLAQLVHARSRPAQPPCALFAPVPPSDTEASEPPWRPFRTPKGPRETAPPLRSPYLVQIVDLTAMVAESLGGSRGA